MVIINPITSKVEKEVKSPNKILFGKPLIHWVVKYEDEKCLEILLKNGANVNIKPNLLCRDNLSLEIVKLLIEYNININESPLFYKQKPEVISYLINNGVDPDIRDERSGETALHRFLDNVEITKTLLENGANPNIKDNYFKTPLHIVEKYDVAKELLEFGADPNIQDINGHSVLHRKASKFTTEVEFIKLLLQKGANPRIYDRYGYLAFQYTKCYLVRRLLYVNI